MSESAQPHPNPEQDASLAGHDCFAGAFASVLGRDLLPDQVEALDSALWLAHQMIGSPNKAPMLKRGAADWLSEADIKLALRLAMHIDPDDNLTNIDGWSDSAKRAVERWADAVLQREADGLIDGVVLNGVQLTAGEFELLKVHRARIDRLQKAIEDRNYRDKGEVEAELAHSAHMDGEQFMTALAAALPDSH